MIRYFLLALFFVLFASRTLDFDLSLAPGLSVKNAFLYLIFAALAIQTVFTRQRRLEAMSVIVPFGLYVGYAIFTWVFVLLILKYPGYSPRTTLISLKSGPIEHFLVFLIYFYGLRNSEEAMWVLRKILWLIIVGNVITVIDVLDIPDLGLIGEKADEAGRTEGPIGNANEYAAFLALFMPAIFALFWISKDLVKKIAGISLLLSGLAFLMAVSRGAVVGMIAAGIAGAFLLRSIVPPRVLIQGTFGALIVGVVVAMAGFVTGYGELMLDRFELFGGSSFEATSGRTVIWGRALGSMLDHPLTFISGFGWYAYESSRFFSYATHNSYLNILYNLGMIGLTLFLLVAINVLRQVRSALNSATTESSVWLFAFFFGFLALLFSIFFGELHTAWLYVWGYVGICLRIALSEKVSRAHDSEYKRRVFRS